MIDPERWILAEAWIANGLRLEWGFRHGTDRKLWQEDEENHEYYYGGFGVWHVLPKGRDNHQLLRGMVPTLGTPTMRHELAHWLIATEDQRCEKNFGLTGDTKLDSEIEEKTQAAERVIESIVASSKRVASMALGAKQ